MNEKLGVMMDHLIVNWKSTVSNLLTMTLVGLGVLLAQPPETLVANGLTLKEIFWMGIISAVAKLYVALITKDAK